jgi:hypothetical protein
MKYCLLFLSTVFIMISACKKVDTPKSDEELLRQSNWKLDTATVSYPLYKTISDYYPAGYDTIFAWKDTMPDCKKDDYLVFRENHEGGLKTGENKCPNGEVEEIGFTWGLTDQSSKVYIYGEGAKNMFFGYENINAKVKEMTDSKLVFTFDVQKYVVPAQGVFRYDTLSYTVTLKKK